MAELGSRLRQLRTRSGKTLRDVAASLECTYSYICMVETKAHVTATPEMICALAALYRVSPIPLLRMRRRELLAKAAGQIDARHAVVLEAFGLAITRGAETTQ